MRHQIKKQFFLLTWSIFVFFAVFTGLFLYTNFINISPSSSLGRDYLAFWSASKLTLAGHPELAFDQDQLRSVARSVDKNIGIFGWFYPPTFQLLIIPIGIIEYRISFLAFIACTFLLFIISARKIQPDNNYIFAILGFPAIYVAVTFGQNSLLTATLAMLGLFYLNKNQVLAGALIGLLTIKPHLALLFPMALIIGGYWRSLITAGVTAILMIVLSIIELGTATWQAFLSNISVATSQLESGLLRWNVMTSTFANVRLLHGSTSLAYTLHIAMACIFTSGMIYVWRSSKDMALRGASLALATLNISPYMYDYELTWLAIPLLFLTARAKTKGWDKNETTILALVWTFPLVNALLELTELLKFSIAPIVELSALILIIKKSHREAFTKPINN
ncbi:MAG: glycosyltransferase family 87 protein [Perlucidibaca sp.]